KHERKQRRGIVDLPARADHDDHGHGVSPMGQAHPERMDDRTGRLGGRQGLIMGGSDRHGLAFAIEWQVKGTLGRHSKIAPGGRFTFPCRRRPHPSYENHGWPDAQARSVRPNCDLVRHMSKTGSGNFFEDFRIGQVINHAVPRTITVGDVALYNGLFGPRFAVQSSDVFARAIGYPSSRVDDLLVFHVVFGKTVPDISLNAVANLGYAAFRVLPPVYPGDTLNAESEVIGLKENSSRKTGIVFV